MKTGGLCFFNFPTKLVPMDDKGAMLKVAEPLIMPAWVIFATTGLYKLDAKSKNAPLTQCKKYFTLC